MPGENPSGFFLDLSSQIPSRSSDLDNISHFSALLKLPASSYSQLVILLLLSLIKWKKWEENCFCQPFASQCSAVPLTTTETPLLLLSEANHFTWIWIFLLDLSTLSFLKYQGSLPYWLILISIRACSHLNNKTSLDPVLPYCFSTRHSKALWKSI